MTDWQPLRELKEYLKAPDLPGVYEIGFRKPGYVARQAVAIGLHAVGYPHDFLPMYVGKHESSIRKRLGEHFIGKNSLGRYRTGSKSSQSIKQYYLELLPELQSQKSKIPENLKFPLGGLYFTCIPILDPANFESFVRLGSFYYPWNRRDEKAAARRAEGARSKDFGYIYKPKVTMYIG